MTKEIIVQIGLEGGNLTLYGVRQDKGWLYSRNLFDQTMSWFDEDAPVIERDSKVVDTWKKALDLLDEYRWHHLYPIEVHPEFLGKILKAVVKRNNLDGNTTHLKDWQKVCQLDVEPIFQEIRIPKLGSTQGKLVSATPSYPKPSGIDMKDWAVSLFNNVVSKATRGGTESVLAVPQSFWPLKKGILLDQVEVEGYKTIDVMDRCGEVDNAGLMTVMSSIREIIDHLQAGQDVIVLSPTKTMSGFIPALLMCVTAPFFAVPAKYWYTLVHSQGLELTPFQVGYIYGLYDAHGPFGFEQLRSAYQAGGFSTGKTDGDEGTNL